MSDLEAFSQAVLKRFCEQITDEIFLFIQNDRELMKDYLNLCDKEKHGVINQYLGKKIKEKFELVNYPARNDCPRSKLIQSHQVFE